MYGNGCWSSVVDGDCRSSVVDCYCGWGCGDRGCRDGDLARVAWCSEGVSEAKTGTERCDRSGNGSSAVGNGRSVVHSYGSRSCSDGWSSEADGRTAHCNGRGGMMNNSGCWGSGEGGSCGECVAEADAGTKGGNGSGHGGTAVGYGWSVVDGDGSWRGSNCWSSIAYSGTCVGYGWRSSNCWSSVAYSGTCVGYSWRSSGEGMTESETGTKGSNWSGDGSTAVGDGWSMVDGDGSWSGGNGRSMVDGDGSWRGSNGWSSVAYSGTGVGYGWCSSGEGVTKSESGTKGGNRSGDGSTAVGDGWSMVDSDGSWRMVDGDGSWSGGNCWSSVAYSGTGVGYGWCSSGEGVTKSESGTKCGNWSGDGSTAVGDGWSMVDGDGSWSGSNCWSSVAYSGTGVGYGWCSSGKGVSEAKTGAVCGNRGSDGSSAVGNGRSMVDGDGSWSGSNCWSSVAYSGTGVGYGWCSSGKGVSEAKTGAVCGNRGSDGSSAVGNGRSMVDGNGCWGGSDGRCGKAHSGAADSDSWRSSGEGVAVSETGSISGNWSGHGSSTTGTVAGDWSGKADCGAANSYCRGSVLDIADRRAADSDGWSCVLNERGGRSSVLDVADGGSGCSEGRG
ncbi:hypothetical protein MTO96_022657 [Rhipicephalus appendiculatus]